MIKAAPSNRLRSSKAQAAFACQVMERIEALAKISEEDGRLTRTFGSVAMREANQFVGGWMREAGMSVRQDEIGNLIGDYPGEGARKILVLGSHLDTVRDAGKWDGPLGVLVAIACVQHLNETQSRPAFGIRVVGFADEEGVRYQSTYLGSRAMAGTLKAKDLELKDANGITMAEAILNFGGDPAL